MADEEKAMLAQSLQKIGKGAMLHDMLNWCNRNQVYRLPASGWVIGARPECVSIPFDELYALFIREVSFQVPTIGLERVYKRGKRDG